MTRNSEFARLLALILAASVVLGPSAAVGADCGKAAGERLDEFTATVAMLGDSISVTRTLAKSVRPFSMVPRIMAVSQPAVPPPPIVTWLMRLSSVD